MSAPELIDPDQRAVLVTGASGFLGRHVCRHLAARGATVHAITRSDPGEQSLENSMEAVVRWHQLDLQDASAVRETVKGIAPDATIHLASLVKGSRDHSLVLPMFEANLRSTVHLLAAATESGCRRFVQAGSLEEPAASDPAPAASPYAVAKAAAAEYCRYYHHAYDLSVALARIFMVYGPGLQDENKLVPYVISHLLSGKAVELSSGARAVDWVYVDDVAEGLVRLACLEAIEPEPVDLGSGDLETVGDLVRQIYDQLGEEAEPPLGTLTDRANETVRRANTKDTWKRTGWRPKTALDDGLAATIDWFRQRS